MPPVGPTVFEVVSTTQRGSTARKSARPSNGGNCAGCVVHIGTTGVPVMDTILHVSADDRKETREFLGRHRRTPPDRTCGIPG